MPKDIAGKRAWILGLTVDCPFSSPLSDCVINQFRVVSLEPPRVCRRVYFLRG